jgi:hypothetical protein
MIDALETTLTLSNAPDGGLDSWMCPDALRLNVFLNATDSLALEACQHLYSST